MILAGIDEAGLGPNLGPLVTACAALRVPEGWLPETTPWDALAAACCREWRKSEARLGVADSKVIYTKGGIAALEKTVGAFAHCLSSCAGGEEIFPVPAAPEAPETPEARLQAHPCYGCGAPSLPAIPLRGGEELSRCLAAAGAEAARLDVGVLFEPVMNARFASGLNKNQILLLETGARLAGLIAAFPGDPMLVVVDKQGGRNDYLPFLVSLFPGAWVEALAAGAEASAYRVRRGRGAVGDAGNIAAEVRFVAKGDRDSFATALASMAAKYVRECLMARLNGWFRARVPGLRATAGYPLDAKRWRAEVGALSGGGGLDDLMLNRVWRVK